MGSAAVACGPVTLVLARRVQEGCAALWRVLTEVTRLWPRHQLSWSPTQPALGIADFGRPPRREDSLSHGCDWRVLPPAGGLSRTLRVSRADRDILDLLDHSVKNGLMTSGLVQRRAHASCMPQLGTQAMEEAVTFIFAAFETVRTLAGGALLPAD